MKFKRKNQYFVESTGLSNNQMQQLRKQLNKIIFSLWYDGGDMNIGGPDSTRARTIDDYKNSDYSSLAKYVVDHKQEIFDRDRVIEYIDDYADKHRNSDAIRNEMIKEFDAYTQSDFTKNLYLRRDDIKESYYSDDNIIVNAPEEMDAKDIARFDKKSNNFKSREAFGDWFDGYDPEDLSRTPSESWIDHLYNIYVTEYNRRPKYRNESLTEAIDNGTKVRLNKGAWHKDQSKVGTVKGHIGETYWIEWPDGSTTQEIKGYLDIVEDVALNEDLVKIPAPYNKYYELDIKGEKDFPDMLGDEVEGYGCKILHYLIAKPEFEELLDEPEAFLVTDIDFPVVTISGDRMYPVEIPGLNEELNEDISSATQEIKPGKEFTSKSGHKIWIDEVNASFSPYDGSPIITMNYHYKLVDGKEGESKCNTVDLFKMLKESLNEDATLNVSEEEMFSFLDDLGGYTDYNGRIDAIVDEFGLGKDEAENVVWNWTLNNEDSEDEETVEDAIIDEPEEEKSWIKVVSKPVPDSDGFLTDYTMYRDSEDPDHYVFVFGDNDFYKPEDGNWDWEAFSNEEATEWYNDYEGFKEEDEDIVDDEIEDLNKYLDSEEE